MGIDPGRRALWDRVANNLQEWYTDAVGWTGEKARIGVKKMDMLGIQHNIKREMTLLGGRVYELVQSQQDVANDPQVRAMVGSLERLEQELAAREREIDSLRSQRRDSGTGGRRPHNDVHDQGGGPESPETGDRE
jgi:hypothetical protein